MIGFFWGRGASVWMSVLYIGLGAVLAIFPEMSSKVFCWCLGALALAFAVSRFWRAWKLRDPIYGDPLLLGGSVAAGVVAAIFGAVCLWAPKTILSALPFVLGAVLLLDGVGKLPGTIDVLRSRMPGRWGYVLGVVIPLVLGVVLFFNPFSAVKGLVLFFGISLMADGICDLVGLWLSRR